MSGSLKEAVADPLEGEAKNSDRLAKLAWVIVWGGLVAWLFRHVLRLDTSVLYYGELAAIPSNTVLIFPLFERGWAFFASLASQPGGITDWAGAYLGQLFIMPYLGATILTAIAITLFVALNSIVSRVARVSTRAAGVVGVVLLASIWNHYEFDLADSLAVTASLGAAALVIRQRRTAVRDVSLVVGSLGLYYVLGGPAVLFAVVCGLYECCVARRYVSAAGWLLVGAAGPLLIGVAAMSMSMGESYVRLTGVGPYGDYPTLTVLPAVFWAWAGLYGLAIIAMILAIAFRWCFQGEEDREDRVDYERIRRIALVVTMGLGVLGIHRTLDRETRWVLRLHSYAAQERWAELVAEADSADSLSGRVSTQSMRHINRALFETGQLGSKMFAYPQSEDGLLAHISVPDLSAEGIETMLEMGLVNQAEHAASRVLELWGPRPSTLKLLARIFIVKNEPDAARLFLRRLERNVIWSDWAGGKLADLDADPSQTSDPDVARIRRFKSKVQGYSPADARRALWGLLRDEPTNRMVFEYIMGSHLIAGRADAAVGVLELFGQRQGYDMMPEHYAEAAAIFMLQTNQRPDLGNLMPSPRVMGRAERAAEIASGPAPEVAFSREMPQSYFRSFFRRRRND